MPVSIPIEIFSLYGTQLWIYKCNQEYVSTVLALKKPNLWTKDTSIIMI